VDHRVTYFVGLDPGQAQDYSALTVVERSERLGPVCFGRPLPADPEVMPRVGHYAVRHLKRWYLGTSYPQIVNEVAALLARPPLVGSQLAVDATGVGRAVVDLFRQARLPASLVSINITGGHQATWKAGGWNVAKKHLAGVLQVLLQQGRLKVPKLPERDALLMEIRAFRVKVSATTGNESFEAWRERDHDDLVLAVALPCWLAERGSRAQGLRIYLRGRGGAGPGYASSFVRVSGWRPWTLRSQLCSSPLPTRRRWGRWNCQRTA
jgi:hypothetical protein